MLEITSVRLNLEDKITAADIECNYGEGHVQTTYTLTINIDGVPAITVKLGTDDLAKLIDNTLPYCIRAGIINADAALDALKDTLGADEIATKLNIATPDYDDLKTYVAKVKEQIEEVDEVRVSLRDLYSNLNNSIEQVSDEITNLEG